MNGLVVPAVVPRESPTCCPSPLYVVKENELRPTRFGRSFPGVRGVGKVGKDTLSDWITRG